MKNQIKHWGHRWRSGVMRLVERILIGVNISDRLGGDGGAIQHLEEIKHQFIGTFSTARLNEIGENPKNGIVLSDVNVEINSGLIRLENGYILDNFLPQWQNLIYSGGLASEYRSTYRRPTQLKGQWTSVSGTPYYYHFVTEDLARAANIRAEFPNIQVAILENQAEWKYELLDYFNFNYQVVNRRNLKFDVYMTSTGGGHQNTDGLEILQKTRNAESNLVGEGRKILLTRKGLAREDLKLESLVETALTSKEFLVVNPELLSIQEQISLFSNAKIIVGFHGGALTNMVWSKKRTEVYEILVHPYRTRDFERLANNLGLDYKVLSLELGLDELMNEIKKIE